MATMEDELDALLSQLDPEQLLSLDSATFDLLNDGSTSSASNQPEPHPTTAASSSRFQALKTDEDVEEAKKKAIPKNTEKNTSWAVNVWKQWSAHRRQVCPSYSDWPTHLMIAVPSELNYWLSKFVLETRKANGDHYPPDTLHIICSGLQRFIRETRPEINLFKDPVFAGFQRTLDSEMKRLRSHGMGVKKKQAEPITAEEENLLWEGGLLGEENPQALLDTMLFLCGIHFALRSGEEHRSLQLSQFELVVPKEGCARLIYTENYSKNNQGGLQHRKVKPKCVTCYANERNPGRCLVRLYQVYLSHRPADIQPFYLTPLRKKKSETWYSKVPVGHNTLSQTVGRLCKKAGITGFKTNHSLRVTSATRLFQSGVDEQVIMSHTGHRSVDGVRSYKRISEEQKKAVSGILTSSTCTKVNTKPAELCVDQPKNPKKMKLDEGHENNDQSLSVTSQTNTNMTLTKLGSSYASCTPSFNFTGCSSVTINYHMR